MAFLQAYFADFNPVIAGEPFYIKLGFYDPEGNLLDVTNDYTNLSFETLNGQNITVFSVPGAIQVLSEGSYRIRFGYAYEGSNYYYDFYFCAVTDTDLVLGTSQIYNTIKNEEPTGGVYSTSTDPSESFEYVDNISFSKLVEKAYLYLNDQTNNIYPELIDPTDTGYLQSWQEMLTGEYDFYSPSTPNVPKLLQFIRNNGFSFNPYDLAFWVSQYIYLKTGVSIYVYIEEFLIPYNQNYWILNESDLGVGTRLAPDYDPIQRRTCNIHVFDIASPVDLSTKNELLYLIERWGMLGIFYNFQFGQEPTVFNLIQDLGNTYKGDPRTRTCYCLRYDPTGVRFAFGLTDPFLPSKLLSIAIEPSNGTYYVTNTIHFEVIGTYQAGYSQSLTVDSSFTNNTPVTLTSTSLPNAYYCDLAGPAQIVAQFLKFTATANITISNIDTPTWELGVSLLGWDTSLG